MRKKGDLREERIPAKIQDLALFLSRAIGVHPYRDGFGFNRRRKLVTARPISAPYSTGKRRIENLHRLSDETRIMVSEPLGGQPGAWQPIPESS